MNRFSWHPRLKILLALVCFIPFSGTVLPPASPSPSKPQPPPAPLIAVKSAGDFQGDSGDCTPENKFTPIDKISGFNGLAIDYAIEGLPLSEFQEYPRLVAGYPSGSQVTMNFTAYGPFSIVDNHATWATIKLNGKEVESARAPDNNGAPGWSYTFQPFVLTITEDMRKNGFEVVADVGYRRASNTEGVNVTVRGMKCDRPAPAVEPPIALPTLPPPEETDLTWIVVVAAAVAGTGVLAAAAAALVRAATRRLGRPPEVHETAGFILQLSQADFYVAEDSPAQLRATAWRVTGSGQPQLAPDAVISVQPPPASSGVKVTPNKLNGDGFFTISRRGKGSSSPVVFSVSAATTESASSPQQVTVRLGSKFTARVNDRKSADITYNTVEKHWSLPEIVCCFRSSDDTPEKTAFDWGAPRPPVVFSPQGYVEMEEFYVHDPSTNAFTIKLHLREGLDFNKDSSASKWLENDGMVDATVSVVDDRQQTHTDTVRLHFRPQLRLAAFSYEGDLSRAGSHTYLKNRWEGMQFLADGIDRLHLALYYLRTDREIPRGQPKGQEYLLAEKSVEIESLEWATGSFLLPPEADAGNTRDGVFAYAVGSNDCVQPAEDLFNKKCQLKVKPRLLPGGPKNYSFENPEEPVVVDPQFILGRLWVVPGQYRGTSMALAYIKTVPSNKPLVDLPLTLSVINQGGGRLSLDGCAADQLTSAVDHPKISDKLQIPKGVAFWTLRYSGLTWDNLPQARFQVVCEGLRNKNGTAMLSFNKSIDVNQNVLDMLNDLFEDPGLQPHLNNPYWKDSSLPAVCRGFTWNMFQWFNTERPFVCHNMRTHIITWLRERRKYHHKEVWYDVDWELNWIGRMNGIEFESYELYGIHVHAGFFLSGNPQTDYKALDPWWEQRWNDPALKKPENLMTMKGEVANLVFLAAAIGVMAAVLVEMYLAVGIMITKSTLLVLIKGVLTGKKWSKLLLKLGLADHLVSTYVIDIDSEVHMGKYYTLITDWFKNAINTLDKSDATKYKRPSTGA